MFRDKAYHIAQKLLPAFNTPTGIPNALVNIATGVFTTFKDLLLFHTIIISTYSIARITLGRVMEPASSLNLVP